MKSRGLFFLCFAFAAAETSVDWTGTWKIQTAGWYLSAYGNSGNDKDMRDRYSRYVLVHRLDFWWNSEWAIERGSATRQYKIKLAAGSPYSERAKGWYLSAFDSSEDVRNPRSYYALVRAPDSARISEWTIENGSTSGKHRIKLVAFSLNPDSASGWYLNASENIEDKRNCESYYAFVHAFANGSWHSEWTFEPLHDTFGAIDVAIVTSMASALLYALCVGIRILCSFHGDVLHSDCCRVTAVSKRILGFIRACREGSHSDEVYKLAGEHRRGQAMVLIRYATPFAVISVALLGALSVRITSSSERKLKPMEMMITSTHTAWVLGICSAYTLLGLWLLSNKLTLRALDVANCCLTCCIMVATWANNYRDEWSGVHQNFLLHLYMLRGLQISLFGNFQLTVFLQILIAVPDFGGSVMALYFSGAMLLKMFYTSMLLYFSWTFEHLQVEQSRTILRAEALHQTNRTVKHLLQGFCDVTLQLDSSLSVVDGAHKLAALLLRQKQHANPVPLARLQDVIVQQDRPRFLAHLETQVTGRDIEQPVLPLNVDLSDSLGNSVPVQLWCTTSYGHPGEYMVGVTIESEPGLPSALPSASTSLEIERRRRAGGQRNRTSTRSASSGSEVSIETTTFPFSENWVRFTAGTCQLVDASDVFWKLFSVDRAEVRFTDFMDIVNPSIFTDGLREHIEHHDYTTAVERIEEQVRISMTAFKKHDGRLRRCSCYADFTLHFSNADLDQNILGDLDQMIVFAIVNSIHPRIQANKVRVRRGTSPARRPLEVVPSAVSRLTAL